MPLIAANPWGDGLDNMGVEFPMPIQLDCLMQRTLASMTIETNSFRTRRELLCDCFTFFGSTKLHPVPP